MGGGAAPLGRAVLRPPPRCCARLNARRDPLAAALIGDRPRSASTCSCTSRIAGRAAYPLPLSQRKHLLATLLHRSKVDCLHLVATFPDGAKLLASAERMQLEGIVSKRRSSPYRSGECKDWRKIKTSRLACGEPGAVADV